MTTETFVYAIPLWLMREYLEELGGAAASETVVVGPGWRGELTKLPVREVGSLRIGQVQLILEGDAEALAALRPGLDLKTLRGGA